MSNKQPDEVYVASCISDGKWIAIKYFKTTDCDSRLHHVDEDVPTDLDLKWAFSANSLEELTVKAIAQNIELQGILPDNFSSRCMFWEEFIKRSREFEKV